MKRYTDADKQTALRLLRKGMRPRAVADVVGCQLRTVRRWASDAGCQLPRWRPGRPGMPEAQRRRVLAALAKHGSTRKAGAALGIHGTTVARVAKAAAR